MRCWRGCAGRWRRDSRIRGASVVEDVFGYACRIACYIIVTPQKPRARMTDRTKFLVHLRRLSGVLEHAIRNGPDGSLDGKFAAEHPTFVHHACAFYLIGCMAFMEGEDGKYSWTLPSGSHADFDNFVAAYPKPEKSFQNRGICKASMQALADIRNAVAHVAGDLSRLDRSKKADVIGEVKQAKLPGAVFSGPVVTLEAPFLEYVRLATLATRNYHGEF